ncbi:MAG: 3-phosphoshikimate 1-carboxyvinyltransferase [Oscillospiraceae bacterium]|nr:3-phosphoshikimate 1-carboxyvinyltransferase [Candidatus Ruminococcus equi]
MSIITIQKSNLCGKYTAPPSKSYAHRVLICSALSRKKVKIKNIVLSDDIKATASALIALGCKITFEKSTAFIDAENFAKDINSPVEIDCKDSATTLRLLIPVCAALGISAKFFGSEQLSERPLDEYKVLLQNHGVNVEYIGSLPFSISGKLKGETFFVNGDISSQFVSGLMLSLPLLENESEIKLLSPLQSKSYVEITRDVLSAFSVSTEKTENGYKVKKCDYKATDYTIEGDWSNASFFITAKALGANININGLNDNSIQGDKKIVEILEKINNEKTLSVDMSDCPDLVPIVAVYSAFSGEYVTLTDINRLKFKESDRIKSTVEMLNSFGTNAVYDDSSITIYKKPLQSANINGYNDHRIVMAASISALFLDNETTISNYESVKKSYPDFFEVLESLGGKINV